MKIEGLQKLTLLDYPEKVACTVFTGGCNLRCPFCHNASLVLEDRGNLVPIASQKQGTYTEEEILEFLKKRKGVLDGICITGGEPLIQKGLAEFIKKIKELGYLVKLDTNGTFPERLEELVNAGLVNYVAMDIKNSRELYPVTVGMPEFDTGPVEESVRFLMEGKVPYEFRTTVVREFHTEESLRDTGIWIAGSAKYRLQQFVDSGDIIHPGLHAWEPETLHKWADMLKTYVSDTEVRGTE
ncbi:MAG TPA: anaerobic ribonucleoside-triphosphate reductase activating protein [Candidatus Bariatricus faecipullorum]|nr:anaerobic ribonucleoside-triphosphate reductase activating protein [Candidatus Bariatricus faecipullorum]